MIVALYDYQGDKRIISKTLLDSFTMNGTLTNDCDVVNPVIEVEKFNPAYYRYNYMYIPDFRRFYYITSWENLANRLWLLHAHTDVLMTYRDEILKTQAVMVRGNYAGTIDLPSDLYASKVSTEVSTLKFNKSFDSQSAVLVVAGIVPAVGG